MFATPGTRRPTNNSVLKTTTWGARLAVLSLIALLAAGLSFADGKKHKLSKDLDALKGGHNGATVDVIMQFNQTPTVAHHQKVQSKGGVLKTNLDFIKGAHYSVPVESLDDLADDPDVAYVSPDREVRGSLDYVTSAVGANVAWSVYGLDGTGIGVALSAAERMTFTVMEPTSLESQAALGKAQRAPIARAHSREWRPTLT